MRTVIVLIPFWLYSPPCHSFVLPPVAAGSRRSTLPSSSATVTHRLCSNGCADALLDWVSPPEEGQESLLYISDSTRGAGLGLFVPRDVARGESLLVIPESKVLSVEAAWDDEQLGDAFCYLTDEGGEGGKMASFAGFMAHEILKKGKSKWYPYLSMLGLHRPTLDDNHVLWWSDEQVESLLMGSNVYEEVCTLRDDTESAIEILWDLAKSELDHPPSRPEWESAARAAYVAILSRAFEDTNVDGTKLVPVLDMAQHADYGNLDHSTNVMTGDVTVTARRDLTTGEELSIEYATELQPHQYFPPYAFVPGHESCLELLQTCSPVFFPPTM